MCKDTDIINDIQESNKTLVPISEIKHDPECIGVYEEKDNHQFPVDVFPVMIQEIINATNQYLQFPIDFIGSSILFAASISIGNTHRVRIKQSWEEGATLYIALVGPIGSNKSHPLKFAIDPIIKHDEKTYLEFEKQNQEYERIIGVRKKAQEESERERYNKPTWKRIIVSDYTPEALVDIHQVNIRGLGLYVDELAGWFKNFNRYNRGSEQEFWLKNWSGIPVNVDRKSLAPILISKPFISVAGTIQSNILYEVGKDNREKNGFIERVLFSFPDFIEKQYWSDDDIDPSVIENWTTIINKLLGLSQCKEQGEVNANLLTFSPEAKKKIYQWQKENTDLIKDSEIEILSGMYSKLEIYVIRISLILQLLHWACGSMEKFHIEIVSIEGAIKIIEYFRHHNRKAHMAITRTNQVAYLPSDKRELYEQLPSPFETHRGVYIAKKLGIPERSAKRFFSDKDYFENISRGEYIKKFCKKPMA